jgi:ribosomal protein L40E
MEEVSTSDKNVNSCEYCGEALPQDATRCKYCASLVNNIPKYQVQDRRTQYFSSAPLKKDVYISQTDSTDGTEAESENNIVQENGLSNGAKVFLTVIFSVIPGIGQLAGIITAMILMSSDHSDRKSFGKALLVAGIIMFLVSFVVYFMGVLTFLIMRQA